MHYTVYFSDPEITASKGFGKVAHLPCIFDAQPSYHRLGSEYLIDRGLGVWHPKLPQTLQPAAPPTDRTILNYANWLANFLEWAEKRHIDISTCTFHEHVYQRYQTELIKGYWSRDGKPLAPATVNAYIGTACDFLTWMAYKGHRTRFDVPSKTIVVNVANPVNSRGHKRLTVEVREGKVRKNQTTIRMPSDDELKVWLAAVYTQHGCVRGLMCETVLMTAMRRSEIEAFRVDSIPLDPRRWHISNPTASDAEKLVRIQIQFGTKGPSYGKDHGDKIGPKRNILVPLHLVKRLHQYREDARLHHLNVWIKAVRGATQQHARLAGAIHLFRDEASGIRLNGKHLYNAWTGVPLPFKGWSPHQGRHWWACSVLWRELKQFDSGKKSERDQITPVISHFAKDVIRLQIQPQLGHASDDTSFIYLHWAMDMLGIALPEQYRDYLDKESSSS